MNIQAAIRAVVAHQDLAFADMQGVMRTIMSGAGSSLMGIGIATGETRAADAARAAISSPLLETSMKGATGVILSIAGTHDLGLFEVDEATLPQAVRLLSPRLVVLLNLFRDQLDRYGEVDSVAEGWARALDEVEAEVADGALQRLDPVVLNAVDARCGLT